MMIRACPRCETALIFHDNEFMCVICGYADYQEVTSDSLRERARLIAPDYDPLKDRGKVYYTPAAAPR